LSDEDIALLTPLGEIRPTAAGEVLFREGDTTYDFIVILEGRVAIVEGYGAHERVLVVGGAREFVTELNMFTGERVFTTAIVQEAGSILVVPMSTMVALVGSAPKLGELIVAAVFARRQWLVAQRTGFRIVGSRYAPDTGRLREFAARNHVAHVWIDLDEDPSAWRMLNEMGVGVADTPVVVLPGGAVLVNPTNTALADAIGLKTAPEPETAYDVIIVGAGPAGLAAAVYASSEGRRVAVLEAVGPGGQIGTTTRFENYLGFPVGISGQDFAERAVVQADRFGTTLLVPSRATGLSARDGLDVVHTESGEDVVGRSVIIATGMEYRRLPVPGIARFESVSVFYSPLDERNRIPPGAAVVVVGGGNSAGQAATAAASAGYEVALIVRGPDLASTMVTYLTDRIDREDRIQVLTDSEVVDVGGERVLSSVVVRNNETGTRTEVPCGAMFILIGAAPYTTWLRNSVELDHAGYVLTGSDVLGGGPRGDRGARSGAIQCSSKPAGRACSPRATRGSERPTASAAPSGTLRRRAPRQSVARCIHVATDALSGAPGATSGALGLRDRARPFPPRASTWGPTREARRPRSRTDLEDKRRGLPRSRVRFDRATLPRDRGARVPACRGRWPRRVESRGADLEHLHCAYRA
jgi:thioredoxin reductase (NADPH)